MGEKLHDIKETASDAVAIIRELGTAEVRDSLGHINETAKIAKEIMDSLKDPEMVKNIDNIRLTAEAMQNTATRFENMLTEIKKTGVIDDMAGFMKSTKTMINSVEGNQNLPDTLNAIREMIQSIKLLVDEIKLSIASSNSSGTILNVKETAHEVSEIYKNITGKSQ